VRRPLESIQWGLFCTSSWTWCIGMYLPFIMLRLWGWPGFLAFMVPNVLGCAAFGFVLDRHRSRALAARLGWMAALFSAVTVAYQCWFAGWASATFLASDTDLGTVFATGAPMALLVLGIGLALRGDAFWRTAGTVVTLASPLVLFLPSAATGPELPDAAHAALPLPPLTLAFALPTVVAGFLASPFLDLTFHRAVQQAPQPRVAFATFGIAFMGMLLMVASFHDPARGLPRVGAALFTLWAVQLAFTTSVHLRELLVAPAGIRIPPTVAGALIAGAVLLATPAFTFGTDPRLLAGEPTYLGILGAYGLLFPVLLLMEPRGASRTLVGLTLAGGAACYLLGAWEFSTYLMPIPVLAAVAWARAQRRTA
jgi:hypothetical protein